MLKNLEYCLITDEEKQAMFNRSLSLTTFDYECGGCARRTHARIIARGQDDITGNFLFWCYCNCGQPTCISRSADSETSLQWPRPGEFKVGVNWPPDLIRLFSEAAISFAGNAFTAASLVCRKILMAVAVDQGAADGGNFTLYVDYITNTILNYPKAKHAIDAIRKIGNEATHKIQFVDHADARRSLRICQYVLDAVYDLPLA
jgi:predicted metal-binding protein